MAAKTISQDIRSLQRMLRDCRLGSQPSRAEIERAEKLAEACAAEVERMEIVAGTASVATQLKAAGGNPVMLREVLRQDAQRKAVSHG